MIKMNWLSRACAVVLTAGFASSASAAGFAIFEAGARATATAGAFTATADDPSAMFYNPAGLASNEKLTAMVGMTLIFPNSKLEGLNPFPGAGYEAKQQKQIFFPPNFYVAAPISKGFNLSLGAWFPYGLSTAWDDNENFAGKYLSKRVDLRTFSFSLQASYQVTEWLAVGAGPELRIGDVKLQRAQGVFDPFQNKFVDALHVDIRSDVKTALGWTAGIMLKPVKDVRVGVAYHSAVDMKFKGNGRFFLNSVNPQLGAVLNARFPLGVDVPVTTTVQEPDLLMFGAAVDLFDKALTLEVNGNYTGWEVFDKTVLEFQAVNGKQVPTSTLEHNWRNTWTIRAGATARFGHNKNTWAAVGFVYDQTPQPDEDVSPLLPDANRTGVSVGLGMHLFGLRAEISNLFLFFHDRTTTTNKDNFSARYTTFADLLVGNLIYSF